MDSSYNNSCNVFTYFRKIMHTFSLNPSAQEEDRNSTISNNITMEEFYFTSIRNIKSNDHFSFKRSLKGNVIQDSRNPNIFMYLTELDR